MAEHSAHQHHDHAHALSGKRLRSALILTTLILAAEVIGGLLSGSLALMADAGHVLTDILALALAWFASTQAERPASSSNTYGYHRTGILAAMINALTLLAIVGLIVFEAAHRFNQPERIQPSYMIAAAAIGIAVNLYIAFGLSKGDHANLNERAVLLHVLGDVGASVAVIVSALVIAVTNWTVVDPITSLLIALLIARGAWGVLREAVAILMEAAPREISADRLAADIIAVPGVSSVHDLHVWSIAGGMHALSAHIQVNQDCAVSSCDALLSSVNTILASKYNIGHSTIQIEFSACDRHGLGELFCSMDHAGHDCDEDHQHSQQTREVEAGAVHVLMR